MDGEVRVIVQQVVVDVVVEDVRGPEAEGGPEDEEDDGGPVLEDELLALPHLYQRLRSLLLRWINILFLYIFFGPSDRLFY